MWIIPIKIQCLKGLPGAAGELCRGLELPFAQADLRQRDLSESMKRVGRAGHRYHALCQLTRLDDLSHASVVGESLCDILQVVRERHVGKLPRELDGLAHRLEARLDRGGVASALAEFDVHVRSQSSIRTIPVHF